MKKILIVIGILALLAVPAIGSYNEIVMVRESVTSSFADVQTQYQRRADLIPNLVETVKGYAKHEQETLNAVVEARSGLQNAKTPGELTQADANLTRSINIMVEAYPELKADQTYIGLMDELAGTENRVQVARSDYNGVVKEYNNKIIKFPTSLFAGMFGFDKAEYFEAEAGSEAAPSVSFS